MVKSKGWSIGGIFISIVCFVISLIAFFVAAIGGKVTMANVASTNYILGIVGIVLGIIALFCSSRRTEWKVGTVASIANLAKIGIMLCIIVLAATLMNTR